MTIGVTRTCKVHEMGVLLKVQSANWNERTVVHSSNPTNNKSSNGNVKF
jgi:hypothetical protein